MPQPARDYNKRMTQALLQQAVDAIRRGDKVTGQRLLAQVLRADPRGETAWLWMSQIVETDAQRLDCMRRILAINPNNATARRGVELLEARMSADVRGDLGGDSSRRPAPIPPEAPAHPSSLIPHPSSPAPVTPFTGLTPGPQAEPTPIELPAPASEPAPIEKKKKIAPSVPRREPKTARRPPGVLLLLIILVALLAGGAILFALNAPRPSAQAGTHFSVAAPANVGGRLAIAIDQEGDTEIAVINSDGSGLTRLTRRKGADHDPAWSPDGKRIAFAAQVSGTVEIAVVDANGQGFTQLTQTAGQSVDPAWSPDGTRIAFASDREGDFDVYVMNVDGSGSFNLTRFEGDDRAPAWTPDSQSIVFQSDREGPIDIYRMNADGSEATPLTDDPAEDTAPAVSPQGDLIAFVSTRDGDADIYVMDIDGSDPRAVTDNPVDDRAPSWTPDGSILFTSILTDSAASKIPEAERRALFVARPDGSGLSRVADDAGDIISAVWQPVDVDPATLAARSVPTPTVAAAPFELPSGAFAFASNRDGNFDLYSMGIDGSNLALLAPTPADARRPSLSPVAAQIAFDAPVSRTQQIFVADSTSIMTLTQSTASARRPAWSPDGTQIAYQIDADRGPDIVVVNADGSDTLRLTDRPGVDGCFSWRPDGEQIAFTSDLNGDRDIFVINVDRTALRSPRPEGVGSEGSNAKQLTQHAADEYCPTWRPDGGAIAFISDRNGEGVYVMDADGSNARLIAAIDTRRASQPAWSGDGKFLLVSSDQDGDSDVYLISIDSTAIWNLTADSDADEVDPVWRP